MKGEGERLFTVVTGKTTPSGFSPSVETKQRKRVSIDYVVVQDDGDRGCNKY